MENEVRDLFQQLKSTLSAAGEMARQGLDIAGKKTGEALDATKIRWKLSELQYEVGQLYREAGQCVYAAHVNTDADSGRLAGLLGELDQKQAEIESLRQALKTRRGESPCPNPICKATVQTGDVFCRQCGARIFGKKDAEEDPA